jgi:hypothetical protein
MIKPWWIILMLRGLQRVPLWSPAYTRGTLVNNIDLPRIVLLGSIRRLPQGPFTDVSSRKSTILVFIHFGGDFHYD